MPTFAGMMPTPKEATLPQGFNPQPEESLPNNSASDDMNLEDATRKAEEEWSDIHNAFLTLAEHFGEDFQPLNEGRSYFMWASFQSSPVKKRNNLTSNQSLLHLCRARSDQLPIIVPLELQASG